MVTVFNLRDLGPGVAKLRPKQARACNSLSINRNGLIAVGLDKVRNDNCLLIWDVDQYSSRASNDDSASRTPLHSYLPNEVISSVVFLPQSPNTLLCGSYKFIRELDVRTNAASFQCATKCAQGISVNLNNEMYFASYSDEGAFSIWDRRQMRSGSATGEPALLMNRLFSESSRKSSATSFRFSLSRSDEFTILHDGNLLRRWQTGTVPAMTEGGRTARIADGFDGRHSYIAGQDTLFISSVLDSKTDFDKVSGFDYAGAFESKYRVNFMCIRQSGQVFRMRVFESPDAAKFDPYNDLAVVEPERVTIIDKTKPKQKPQQHRHRRLSSKISASLDDDDYDESEEDNEMFEGILHHATVLSGDVSTIMRKRALRGYSTDCDNNITLLSTSSDGSERHEYLRYTWTWLSLASKSEAKGTMLVGPLDLGLEGVLGIWEGSKGLTDQNRYDEEITDKEFTNAIKKIVADKKHIFTSPTVSGSSKEAHRQLCLRVSGWNFELTDLEERLKELEATGKHEQAAGWAVFHGDVDRAVTALARSRKERLRLMSTAVAGYMAYKHSDVNSPWREQCRKLASELDNSYLRAIFAYISDGSWLDVLDEGSLPLIERLGIALRFLPDNELAVYLSRLTDRAVQHGDLEGIILTGLTPRVVDLLQSYVDKTSDVQTAALIASFCCPRYFQDKRVESWVGEYRGLLNSWQLFSHRAKFDVARTQLSRRSNGVIAAPPVPRQIYLRCNHCKKVK
jgi:hypothetical protein